MPSLIERHVSAPSLSAGEWIVDRSVAKDQIHSILKCFSDRRLLFPAGAVCKMHMMFRRDSCVTRLARFTNWLSFPKIYKQTLEIELFLTPRAGSQVIDFYFRMAQYSTNVSGVMHSNESNNSSDESFRALLENRTRSDASWSHLGEWECALFEFRLKKKRISSSDFGWHEDIAVVNNERRSKTERVKNGEEEWASENADKK